MSVSNHISPPSSRRVCVDWSETAESHVFTVEVPGLKKEQLKVEIDNDSHLRISGDKITHFNGYSDDNKPPGWWLFYRLQERNKEKFERRFKLPENAKVEETTAALKDGILTIILPTDSTVHQAIVKSIPISDS